MNNYTIKSFVVLIRTFSVKLVNKFAYGQCVTKNDVQNVYRQPAHKQTNDDATDESLLGRHSDVIIGTALPSKQEKYLPTCMLGPLRWSMPKITKSDAKLSEIYEQNEWHLFSGQRNLRFLSTNVLQGGVGTCVNYGRIFIDFFTANLLQSVTVKKFENRLAFRGVTGKNKVAPFFRTRCISTAEEMEGQIISTTCIIFSAYETYENHEDQMNGKQRTVHTRL